MSVKVTILARVADRDPIAIGRLTLAKPEDADQDMASLLRRLADTLESDNYDALPDGD